MFFIYYTNLIIALINNKPYTVSNKLISDSSFLHIKPLFFYRQKGMEEKLQAMIILQQFNSLNLRCIENSYFSMPFSFFFFAFFIQQISLSNGEIPFMELQILWLLQNRILFNILFERARLLKKKYLLYGFFYKKNHKQFAITSSQLMNNNKEPQRIEPIYINNNIQNNEQFQYQTNDKILKSIFLTIPPTTINLFHTLKIIFTITRRNLFLSLILNRKTLIILSGGNFGLPARARSSKYGIELLLLYLRNWFYQFLLLREPRTPWKIDFLYKAKGKRLLKFRRRLILKLFRYFKRRFRKKWLRYIFYLVYDKIKIDNAKQIEYKKTKLASVVVSNNYKKIVNENSCINRIIKTSDTRAPILNKKLESKINKYCPHACPQWINRSKKIALINFVPRLHQYLLLSIYKKQKITKIGHYIFFFLSFIISKLILSYFIIYWIMRLIFFFKTQITHHLFTYVIKKKISWLSTTNNKLLNFLPKEDNKKNNYGIILINFLSLLTKFEQNKNSNFRQNINIVRMRILYNKLLKYIFSVFIFNNILFELATTINILIHFYLTNNIPKILHTIIYANITPSLLRLLFNSLFDIAKFYGFFIILNIFSSLFIKSKPIFFKKKNLFAELPVNFNITKVLPAINYVSNYLMHFRFKQKKINQSKKIILFVPLRIYSYLYKYIFILLFSFFSYFFPHNIFLNSTSDFLFFKNLSDYSAFFKKNIRWFLNSNIVENQIIRKKKAYHNFMNIYIKKKNPKDFFIKQSLKNKNFFLRTLKKQNYRQCQSFIEMKFNKIITPIFHRSSMHAKRRSLERSAAITLIKWGAKGLIDGFWLWTAQQQLFSKRSSSFRTWLRPTLRKNISYLVASNFFSKSFTRNRIYIRIAYPHNGCRAPRVRRI